MDIKTLWINVVNYMASTLAAVAGGFLTTLFGSTFGATATQSTTIAGGVGLGILIIAHHYLDGLLGTHIAAITSAVTTAQSATPGTPVATTLNGVPIAASTSTGTPIPALLTTTAADSAPTKPVV